MDVLLPPVLPERRLAPSLEDALARDSRVLGWTMEKLSVHGDFSDPDQPALRFYADVKAEPEGPWDSRHHFWTAGWSVTGRVLLPPGDGNTMERWSAPFGGPDDSRADLASSTAATLVVAGQRLLAFDGTLSPRFPAGFERAPMPAGAHTECVLSVCTRNACYLCTRNACYLCAHAMRAACVARQAPTE